MKNQNAEKPSKRRILLVDDHPIVRQGMAQLINGEPDLIVCGEADDAQRALTAVSNLQPDLVIVDITLQGTNGLELIKSIKAAHPEILILVLSMHDESLYAERALRAGARGYVMKKEPPEKAMQGIRQVLKGETYVSEKIGSSFLHQFIYGRSSNKSSPIERLSDRELEVLTLIGRGHGTRHIAEMLNLSVKTIETHRAHLKEKLSLIDAPGLVRFAVEWVICRKRPDWFGRAGRGDQRAG